MRILLLTLYLVLTFNVQSQGFRARFSNLQASNNNARGIFEISPGNYITAGFSIDTASGYSRTEIVMTGLNSQGQILWQKKHNGGKVEYLNNDFVIRCFYKRGDFIYYAGCVQDSDASSGRQFGVFLKYDLNGDTLWRKIYKSSDPLEDLIPQKVTGSVDNGFLITGFFQHWGNHTRPCLLLKTDQYGNELWRKKLNKASPNVCDGKAIIQDSSSKKIIICGNQYIGPSSSFSVCDHVLILDSVGTKLLQTRYSNDGGNLVDIIQTRDKGIVMAGTKIYSQTYNPVRSYAIKIDLDSPLVPLWKIDGYDQLHHINSFVNLTEMSNGDILFSGVLDTTFMNIRNCLIRFTRTDKDGNIKFNRYFDYKINSPSQDNNIMGNSLECTSDGGWVISLNVVNNPTPNPFFVVKYDSTGCDSTLAYCSYINSVGINELSGQNLDMKVYPNPVSDQLFIDIEHNPSELFLMDISGKELNHEILAADHVLNTSSLLPGMYFLRIKNKETITTIKIVKQL